MREKAVIFVPCAYLEQAATICLEYGQAAGYDIEGICLKWDDAQAMAVAGVVQVVIAASRSHLPPDRAPRIEIPEEITGAVCRCRRTEGPPSPTRRRPKEIG